MDAPQYNAAGLTPLIRAQNLTKGFKGLDRWAVEDLSFQASAGEIIGLVGENGAGKSTLLRMLATILKPTSGRVSVAGFDTQSHPGSVRQSIGILFGQHSGLYERLSARENILYFAELNGLSGREAQDKLSEISSLLDMDDFLNRPAGTFSTGMRQKTLIARSIIHDPKVLLLDEPSTGLDVSSSKNIHDFIQWYRNLNKTVVFSSHDLATVERISDRVLMLHKGRQIASGTPSELSGEGTLEDCFFQRQGAAL